MGIESASNGMYLPLVIALLAAAGTGFALCLQLTSWGRWLEKEFMWAVIGYESGHSTVDPRAAEVPALRTVAGRTRDAS